MNKLLLLRFLLLVFLGPVAVSADPVSEMAGFSVFGKVDLATLAGGDVKTVAGAPMSTPRYLSVQSCFVLPRTPGQVAQAMKQFDPTAHRDLKVYLHSDIGGTPSAKSFAQLQNPPANSAVKALSAATEKMSSTLQVSRPEAQKWAPGKSVFGFWTDLLVQRAQAFVGGGARAQAAYDQSGAAVQPGQEISALVRQQGAVNKQFSGLLSATGLIGGKGALRPELYWELLEVEDEGVLTLGASYTRGTAGGGYQIADGLYYASGGYYVALTLYQLWPVEVGGKPSTLVWRGDLISAASLGDLHGVERIASEGAMKKDITRAVKIIQHEVGR